nr:ATP synthase F0 subunit 6 [Rufusia pilicola]
MALSPLEQFNASSCTGHFVPVLGSNLHLTAGAIAIWLAWALHSNQLVVGLRTDVLATMASILHSLYRSTVAVGSRSATPPLTAVGMSAVAANLAGIIPCVTTVTSHLALTFLMSAALKTFIVFRTIVLQRERFLRTFLPADVPLALCPLLISLESVSYFVRVVTLSVRLFANMTSGHLLLGIVASATAAMLFAGPAGTAVAVMPTGLLALLLLLESAVAAIQAFVLSLLCSQYLWESEHCH